MSQKFSRQEVVTWETRLQRAHTAEEIVQLARDFLGTWSPHELGALPSHLRPRRMSDCDDVGLYAFKLMSTPPAGANAHIHARMTTFFTAASHRLSQILSIAERSPTRAKSDASR